MDQLILVLDEGTTSTRAILFGPDGRVHGSRQEELTQHYPRPGRVEHDAAQIWDRTLACAKGLVDEVGADRVACIGITNQRETVVAWDRRTLRPLSRAIVWQDRRTADMCERLRERGYEDLVQSRTGLLLDPYFSGTKMRWLMENEPAVSDAQASDSLALGTVESWLVARLTGGERITDASNASRTLLLPLDGPQFDPGLCEMFGVPHSALGRVVDTNGALAQTDPGLFGRAIPITALVGDQQSATIGQGCFEPGETKATFGTGAFILANAGREPPTSRHRLLGTVLYQQGGERTYAIEGSVFVAGSLVQWLRDSLGIIGSAAQTEELARLVEDSGEVVIVPALAGLGAPHWRADARGLIAGLSFNSGRAQIARAALEAMAHQTHDLAQAFAADGARWKALRIDGGMSANDWMAQDLADILNLPVERPDYVETTALGAAVAASVGAGLHPDLPAAARAMRSGIATFEPVMEDEVRTARLERWRRALAAA